ISWQRQWRARQMVWIALALLAFTLVVVGVSTAAGRWTMGHRSVRGTFGLSLQEFLNSREAAWSAVPYPAPVSSLGMAIDAANGLILERSDFMVFTRGFIFLIFFSFLVPIWTLSFATEAIGGERESN